MAIARQILLRTRNVSVEIFLRKQNKYCISINFFSPEFRILYKIVWKNVQTDRPQMTI